MTASEPYFIPYHWSNEVKSTGWNIRGKHQWKTKHTRQFLGRHEARDTTYRLEGEQES